MKKSLTKIVLLSAIFVGMISCGKDKDTDDKNKDTEFVQITETYEGTLTLTNISPVSNQVLSNIPFSNVHLTVKKISENEAVLSFVEDRCVSEGIKGLDVDGDEVVFLSNFSIENSLFVLWGYYPNSHQTLYDKPDLGYGDFEYNTTLDNNTITYTNDENGYTFTGTTIVQNEDAAIVGSVVNQQINVNFGSIINFVGNKTK